MPSLSVPVHLFMANAAIVSHKMAIAWYLFVLAVVMFIDLFCAKTKQIEK
jgi:hypothetical protein